MQEKKPAMIDIIVTHYDEPWEICKPFFDMLAMQRNIDFDDIRIILVQDGKENALPWETLLDQYPFRISIASVNHMGTASARNAGLKLAEAEWVMFCDIDDFFSDVVSIRGIMNVLPTDDADIIWMRSYREEKTRATKKEKDGVFVNCLNENFYFTDGKLYRLDVLRTHDLTFNADLKYEYENAFNHVALSMIPSHRVMGLTVDFLPYFKTYRSDSYTQDETRLEERINHILIRDLYLVLEYKKRGIKREYVNLVAETVFDMYYLLESEPTISNVNNVREKFADFYRSECKNFDEISETELEVVHDNCVNKMLGIVQNLYNYYGLEIMPPETGIANVRSWLQDFSRNQTPDKPAAAARHGRRTNPLSISLPHKQQNHKYSGPKVVVYCGTYNTYVNMIASAKSVLAHTQVDQIYFLTEDDVFPYDIPEIITNINVKNQQYFPEGGPNFDNVWSYMCMMRAAFPQLFPQYDRILSFDIDIVVNEDISSLWDLDLTDYYYAGVPEPCRQKTSTDPVYCNFGVILMNLDKIRADGKDQETIDLLNTSKLGCPEQDAFNRVCAGHILPLPPDYNYTPFSHITGEPEREIITHYAGLKYWKHFEPVRRYASMSWEQLLQHQNEGSDNMILQRHDIINRFITARNYRTFLEIGTDKGEAFKRINAPVKVSVDPDRNTPATYHMTSDDYFASTKDRFDIIFIDGLHEHNQVMRDIQNSLAHLNPDGVIILHDCNPSTEAEQCYSTVSLNDRVWLGTVWKAYIAARATLPYEMCVMVPHNGDCSCGIIDTNRPKQSDTSALPTDMDSMTWDDFKAHPEWLNYRPTYDWELIQHQADTDPVPRVVFMFGTRDFYHMMTLSLKSLLKHTYVDKIYFMIEDDFFPEPLPPFVQCMNVSSQSYFPHDGPNYNSIYSYMVLLRVALPLMFPDISVALCIDADTLTQDDLGPIWEQDMSDSYLAAVKEYRSLHGADYFNCGVMLMNFDLMRKDNIPEQAIKRLNERYYRWKEQDVLNDLCRYHIIDLPPAYNLAPGITGSAYDGRYVRHYIGSKIVKDKMLQDAQPYESMSWNEIVTEREGAES